MKIVTTIRRMEEAGQIVAIREKGRDGCLVSTRALMSFVRGAGGALCFPRTGRNFWRVVISGMSRRTMWACLRRGRPHHG